VASPLRIVDNTTTRLKGKRPGGGNYEFDRIAHNGEEIVVVEVTKFMARWLG